MSILTNVSTALFGTTTAFSLRDLEGFPYTQYEDQLAMYKIFEDWYEGIPLQITTLDEKTGKQVEKYPIKINPLKGTCQKHAATVMGQGMDSIRFGGLPFQLIPDVEKGKKKEGETIKKALMKVFLANQLGATFQSNCITSQYYGGSLLQAKWVPKTASIEISTPNPKEFVGVPDGVNYWRLREGWIVKNITEADAKEYGYTPKYQETQFLYIEHWTKEKFKIMVNGEVAKFPGSDLSQEGDNPFEMVPIIYIPHIRTSRFLGESIITETVKGIIKELNLRMADIGDAVSVDSHGYIAVRNIRGNIQTIFVGDGRPILNLGSTSGIGNDPVPDMFPIATKSASEPMSKFTEDLYKIYRREVNHPAVADGEDEGSQRSSLTLAVRMAPLVSEAEIERLFYSVGITEFARILLTMMSMKSLHDIKKEMIETMLIVQWQSMLPRDREALTTEAAVRSKNKLGSNKHIMGLFGDIQDTDEELEQIRAEKDLVQPASPFGNNGGGSAPNEKPNPNAKIGGKPNAS